MKTAAIIAIIIIAVVGITLGLIAYSYTQIQISLESVSYQGLDFASPSASTILKLAADFITGNWLGFALTLVTGVKLGLVFGLSNHGFFPVYIPDVSYDILVNGVKVGQGQSHIDSTINPGEIRSFKDNIQDIQFGSMEPAIASIVDSGGIANFHVSGTAYFNFLGMTIPVPFQSSRQINVIDEIKNHINSYISQNQQYSQQSHQGNQGYTNSYQSIPITPTSLSIQTSSYNVVQGQTITFSGKLTDANGNSISNALISLKRSIALLPDLFLGSAYTDLYGQFSINWVAIKPITTNTAYIHVSFDGSSQYSQSRSQDVQIQVSIPQTQIQSQPLLQPQSQSYLPSRVWMAPPLTQVGPNSIVTLNVRLMGTGGQEWISNARVDLMQHGTVFDPVIQSCTTDSYGYCKIKLSLSNVGHYFFYATFQGSSTYASSKSDNVEVDIGYFG